MTHLDATGTWCERRWTRAPTGSSSLRPARARRRAPRTLRSATHSTAGVRYSPLRIEAEDLSPVKARILLMLALTQTRAGAVIQRMFQQY